VIVLFMLRLCSRGFKRGLTPELTGGNAEH
jgi:hypothetical protein